MLNIHEGRFFIVDKKSFMVLSLVKSVNKIANIYYKRKLRFRGI